MKQKCAKATLKKVWDKSYQQNIYVIINDQNESFKFSSADSLINFLFGSDYITGFRSSSIEKLIVDLTIFT